MVNSLYWESALVYAFVLSIILVHDIHIRQKHGKGEKTFRVLLLWVIFFCLQDVFWGICGGTFNQSDRLFFAASTIFHISTVVTTFFWLHYVLTYWNIPKGRQIRILLLDGCVIVFQIVLLVRNLFVPTVFYIESGILF